MQSKANKKQHRTASTHVILQVSHNIVVGRVKTADVRSRTHKLHNPYATQVIWAQVSHGSESRTVAKPRLRSRYVQHTPGHTFDRNRPPATAVFVGACPSVLAKSLTALNIFSNPRRQNPNPRCQNPFARASSRCHRRRSLLP